MKQSVRLLFSTLLFTFLTATLIFSVVILRRSFSVELTTSGDLETEEFIFNKTLLEFSTIDPGEPNFKNDIDLISNYDLISSCRSKSAIKINKFLRKFSVTLPLSQICHYWSEFKRNLNLFTNKKAYDPNIMLDLIKLVKTPIEAHNNGVTSTTSKRYSSCAVVGNSGTLLNSHYGDFIDKHEIVIRLNNAITQRYENKVGSKTNLSFINSNVLHQCARTETCYCHPYGESVPIVVYICQPIHVLDYTVCKSSHKSPLVITDPRFDVLCARIVKYYSIKRFMEEKKTLEGFEDWSKAHEGWLFHYSSGMQCRASSYTRLKRNLFSLLEI